jgi:hypothetical protein
MYCPRNTTNPSYYSYLISNIYHKNTVQPTLKDTYRHDNWNIVASGVKHHRLNLAKTKGHHYKTNYCL